MSKEVVELLVLQNRRGKAFARLIKNDDGDCALGYTVNMDFVTVDISAEVYKELAELGATEYARHIHG